MEAPFSTSDIYFIFSNGGSAMLAWPRGGEIDGIEVQLNIAGASVDAQL
jgi:hypothetical protein